MKRMKQEEKFPCLFRDKFCLPANKVYFCGHSLGPQPKSVDDYLKNILLDKWKHEIVEGHFKSPYAWADIGPKFDPLAICLLLMSSLTSGSAPLAYSYGYNFAPKAKSPSIPSSYSASLSETTRDLLLSTISS